MHRDKVQKTINIMGRLFEFTCLFTVICIPIFLKYKSAFHVLKEMDMHAFGEKENFFLQFATSVKKGKCSAVLNVSSS